MSEFVGILIFCVMGGAVLLLLALNALARFMPADDGPAPARPVSNVTAARPSHYVTRHNEQPHNSNALPARGNAEEEYRAEAEAVREAPNALTASDINRLLEEAREQGAARALGNLIGAGLLPEGNRSRSMQALFGPAGRRHTRVRPWVAEAEGAARAARSEELEAEEAPRVVTVSPGRPDERKLVL